MTSLYPRDPGDPHDEEAVDAVLMVGPDGRIQSASPGAETLFGRTAGGLVGSRFQDLVADDAARVNEVLALPPHDDVVDGAVLSSLLFKSRGGGPPFKGIVRVSDAERTGEEAARALRIEVRASWTHVARRMDAVDR